MAIKNLFSLVPTLLMFTRDLQTEVGSGLTEITRRRPSQNSVRESEAANRTLEPVVLATLHQLQPTQTSPGVTSRAARPVAFLRSDTEQNVP